MWGTTSPHANSQASLAAGLRLYRAAIVACFVLWREFSSCGFWDFCNTIGHKRKSARSIDHLVGAREDCRRQLDAQCFCDAEINPEVELGRSFERQVVRLRAFQNAIKLRDQVTVSVGEIRPERYKAVVALRLRTSPSTRWRLFREDAS